MLVIINHPYVYLEEEFKAAFAGQADVKVIVNRRHGERRTSGQPPVEVERRRSDRRTPKEELVEVVISG